MKKIEDICFIVQARLDSKRMPKKMAKEFCGKTLLDITIEKLVDSKVIPNSNVYISLYDEELKQISSRYDVNIFNRSKNSVSESKEPRVVSEWCWMLPHKYFVTINACAPLLKIETIERFVTDYLHSESENMFAVFQKKNLIWDGDKNLIVKYPGSLDTKLIDIVYEAAHCLYAGSKEQMSNNIYLGNFTKNNPELWVMDELESFDIDYQWQFDVAEILYKNRNKIL
jgi:CMP-N-acetylneuraminic acid synthetase